MAAPPWQRKLEHKVTLTDGKGNYVPAVLTTTQEQDDNALYFMMQQPNIIVVKMREPAK